MRQEELGLAAGDLVQLVANLLPRSHDLHLLQEENNLTSNISSISNIIIISNNIIITDIIIMTNINIII